MNKQTRQSLVYTPFKIYSSITWDSTKLSKQDLVEEVPSHLNDPIPDPDKSPYEIEQIIYVSTPVFNKKKDKVLMFATTKSGPLNFSRNYYIIGKENNQWIVKAKGFISGG